MIEGGSALLLRDKVEKEQVILPWWRRESAVGLPRSAVELDLEGGVGEGRGRTLVLGTVCAKAGGGRF